MILRASDLTPEQRAQLGLPPAKPKPATKAKSADGMNNLERQFQEWLDEQIHIGNLAWRSRHDGITLKLAKATRYTPDFVAITKAGEVVVYECKGFWRDDARVKIKVAADQYPFRFVAVQLVKRQWAFEEFRK